MAKRKETLSERFEKELQQMYVRTEHWISDYAFFEDELKFLINLMDKYFVGAVIADADKNGNLKQLVGKLLKLNESRKNLELQIRENFAYLARLMQNKEIFDPEECRDRQSDLESDQTDFLRKYRTIKKEVFELSEHLLASQRSRKLIG
ncbi:MAG TPA: hypothetical protein VFE50_08830 [Cyclobacteriaceae bacterium]|nr:hypothetical protein [Cyclobacteriaceae bacterium]